MAPSRLINEMFFHLALATLVQATTTTSSTASGVRNIPASIFSSYVFDIVKRWPIIWTMASLCCICGLGSYTWNRQGAQKHKGKRLESESDRDRVEESSLVQKYSTWKSYTTSSYTYTSIRTFHHALPQAEKLPKDTGPLPLIVFIHGLGGSVAQFAYLLSTLIHVGSCLGVDLPGCGMSDLLPQDWTAYTHESLVELLEVIIQQVCDVTGAQEVVLIGHSMGCSLSVSLALSTRRQQKGSFRVKGIIAICPKVSPIPPKQVKIFRQLLNIPSPIFNAWRNWDQKGGIASPSVARFVGKDAHEDTKKLQLRFNQQSRTETFRRIARGALPLSPDQKGLPGPEEWSQLSVPLFVVAGESDVVTPPKEVDLIINAFSKERMVEDKTGEQSGSSSLDSQSSTVAASIISGDNRAQRKDAILKTTILPSPASHGLIYDFTTYRTLSGLIQEFIARHIDHRLGMGWQLQTLKESNKWDVKNLAKWQAVEPVSEPICGVFYALKTLREVDETHSPKLFTQRWNKDIKAIIDISYESPVYDPRGLENGGIQYHKLPTVSKIPPTVDEVREFISLVDRLRDNTDSNTDEDTGDNPLLIGVHCHYGYNRTGFFICTYLIEKLGYSVQAAIDGFEKCRPPGIRHEHFLDTLFVRYCVGLKRAPTI